MTHNVVDDSVQLDSERDDERDACLEDKMSSLAADLAQHSALAAPSGISRQQLINRSVKCAVITDMSLLCLLLLKAGL